MSQFCLKWNNHFPNMLAAFENLKSTENFVDVTIACEGRIVKAHKLVLSAGSKFFQNLFLSNPCSHPIIVLHDVQYNILKTIIDFMYKGEINVMHDQLQALLKTAKTLDIKGLAEICRDSARTEHQETASQPVMAVNSLNQSADISPHPVRRKKIRLRKQSCDSTFSNEEMVSLKTEEPMSPGQMSESYSVGVSTVIPENRLVSECVTNAPLDLEYHSVTVSSKDLEERDNVDADYNVEPFKILEQSLTTERASPKQPFKSDEPSQNTESLESSSSVTLATDSLNSTCLLDTNDSEGDCDIMDMKPHFLHQVSIRRKRTNPVSKEYLTASDLGTVFQRCRNPSQFAVNIARMLFSPDELRESNCRGVKDKSPLDRRRLEFIRSSVMKFYNILPIYELDIWKQCMQSIDSRCRHERRPKYKNVLTQNEDWII